MTTTRPQLCPIKGLPRVLITCEIDESTHAPSLPAITRRRRTGIRGRHRILSVGAVGGCQHASRLVASGVLG
jgi:hypothetical protein